MIVHLGQDASALAEDIVMILNIADGVPEETRAFLKVQRAAGRVEAVSYTHLDVYKRQVQAG